MNTVPNMISTKDLSYISDMFNWNYVLAKKSQFYLQEALEDDLKKEITKVAKLHEEICKDLIKMLKDGINE